MRTSDAKLAAALREAALDANEVVKVGFEYMAQRAEQSYYNDFFSPLDTPIMQLINDLTDFHTEQADALAERAKNGEFDADKEESDEWAEGKEALEIVSDLARGLRGETKGGRLQFRVEGDKWSCYYALPKTVDDPIWMGSVAIGVVAEPARKEMFMELMRQTLAAFFEAKGVRNVEWEVEDVPKSERGRSA
jgi:hypothetical protein